MKGIVKWVPSRYEVASTARPSPDEAPHSNQGVC
jgi:hypothetical protein